ncbi:MAG: cephalosporin hydroxylase family protein [Gammaproteobacteria bacterium]
MSQFSQGDFNDAAFQKEREDSVAGYANDKYWRALSRRWLTRAFDRRYMYNFDWLGRPIIQTPIDIVAMQELIWKVNPDLIIETGIARGGSVIFSASMLALLDMCDAIEAGTTLNPKNSKRKVLGLDIDIRTHNRQAIEGHPMFSRIQMIEGSSVDADVIARVERIAGDYRRILVCLDSNHTHEHVLAELEAYARLVSPGSYCVVFDTIIEDMPGGQFPDRPWDIGNNPKTAIREYLTRLAVRESQALDGGRLTFEIDKTVEDKLSITVAPDGFLKRV